MARARNIKPGFFENEILGKADPYLSILFIALWCLADREGRLEDRPGKIDKFAFGYREKNTVNVEKALNELHEMGFIIRYKVADQKIIQVRKFKDHQSPHVHEKKSVLPEFDANSLIEKDTDKSTVQAPYKTGSSIVVSRSDSLIPDSLNPDCGYLIPEKKQRRESQQSFEFEQFWKTYPKRPGANKTQAFQVWIARQKEGCSWQSMLEGAQRYARYCQIENVEPKFIKQASTFLGPHKHFLLDWKTQSKADSFDAWLTGKGADDDVIDV